MDTGLAKGVGENCNVDLRPMMYGGHCLYVRKTLVGDPVGDRGDRAVNGIIIPQLFYAEASVVDGDGQTTATGQITGDPLEQTCWVEVLAKGPKVGKPCSEEHAEKFGRDFVVADDIEIGDLILLPREHIGIQRSPVAVCEYFVEESLPIVKAEEPDGPEPGDR